MGAEGETGWFEGDGGDGSERVVAHVDMDCFYAACERLREPALKGEPLVVGMGFEPGETIGAVATASYEAREFGVESAMAITQALDRLPRKVDAATDPDLDVDEAGFYRPVDMEYYESVSSEVKEILRERADVLREVSIDEAYLDVTDRVGWDGVREWAADLRATVESEVGVVASVGVAPTMSAAKVASDRDKPDGLVVVRPGEVRDFFADLPVEEVHGVGPVTADELGEMGIETAGDLAATDRDRLADRFGERGLEIRRFARGEDDREVTPRGRPKSLSRESAFAEPTGDREAVRDRVRSLADSVADRAASKDVLYQTIGIKVVTPPYDVNTRTRSLPGPVEDPDLVEEVALDLLGEFEGERVRKVGVRVSKLSFTAGEQASLTGWDGAGEGERSEPSESASGSERRERHASSDGSAADGDGDSGSDDGESSAAADGDVTDEHTDDPGVAERGADGQSTLGDF
ncbi:DNA polymerase IV [Halomicrobium salinisoli]|uniref:DNA polymerase IV n=1 Tax=Halomicrobium salinisoli TaxID=2878391 RepID=UPI001CEFF217|nr:DNA polymerase IV [Halomicrobium salinisoli]